MKKRSIWFSVVFLGIVSFTISACNTMATTSLSEGEKFTITWKNYDGTVLEVDENVPYGTLPTYDRETPVRVDDSQFIYVFGGWNPSVTVAKSDQTYSAEFQETTQVYTVTFKNYDGTSLQSSNWAYGSTPVYSEATPTKSSDSQYSYTFSGWSPAITAVTGNATYTAQFTSSTNQYLITFKNYDGSTLQSSNWAYGTTPVYSEATPTKPSDNEYSYSFIYWSPAITAVTGNATYTAQFTSSANKYLITFKNYDGTSLQSSNWAYGATPFYFGSTPTKPSDNEYSYSFRGWVPEITPVTGNATYTATFNRKHFMGSYPQTKVTDSALITILNDSSGALPTSDNSHSWTSYNYYISSSNATNFMWYQDIRVGEDLYRGVYFTSYRPYVTVFFESSADYSHQDDNGYLINTCYWFKFEPISWDILSVDESAGSLVLSSKIIDSQDYYHSISNRTINGKTVYPNNYKESNIRTWLNSSFLNTAFSPTEQNLIKTTNVDNSVYSTGYNPNPYATTNTDDKLFLLSYRDIVNPDYGFSTSTDDNPPRSRLATDYAKAMGVHVDPLNNSIWLLRSPDYRIEGLVQSSRATHHYDAASTRFGVLPAFRIEL